MADEMKNTENEAMETEEKESSSSDSDSNEDVDLSGDESDKDEQKEAEVAKLEKGLSQNPYAYDTHVQLIELLSSMGELDRLRIARERMSKLFPLTQELWLAWLRDEIKLASSAEEKQKVTELFEKAVQDYLSVDIWLEWAQFSMGGLGSDAGVDSVRAVLDRALTAAGLHVAKGMILWEAYREFENAMLSMQPADSPEHAAQREKVFALFRRQLSVPLLDMEVTREELNDWATLEEQSLVDPGYKKALKKLAEITPFEERLLREEDTVPVYKEYIQHEMSKGEPARVQQLYERSLAQSALNVDLWLDYVNYVDRTLKVPHVAEQVIERAIRNIPWDARLWVAAIRSGERYQSEHIRVQGILEQSLSAGLSSEQDYRMVWEAYLDYLRRRVPWTEPGEEKEKRIKELRDCSARAIDHLLELFGGEADVQGDLTQAWARCEASHCQDMERARQLWNDLLAGENLHGVANAWLQFIALEKEYGDEKHVRKLFPRALAAARDWPESIGQAWISFERDQGTLETFEFALEKVRTRMKKVEEVREKEQEKQTASKFKKMKLKRKWQEEATTEQPKQQWANLGGKHTSLPAKHKPPAKQAFVPQEDTARESKKSEFKTPRAAPPPGYKPDEKMDISDEKKPKGGEETGKENRTVFVSNLDFETTEDEVKEAFTAVGKVTDIRLVRDFKGRSKGFCYVEFKTQDEALDALKKDREPLKGRPMFVSRCDPDKHTRQKVFKYNMGMEKNKLFVRGLPMSMNQEQVRDLFATYGALKDVRLVTYRNGHSKGLAYIDFEDETEAAQALIKTDGLELEGHTISVAISRPPERKMAQASLLTPEVPSLGGRNSLIGTSRGSRGPSLMPRSVRLALPSESAAASSNGATAESSSAPVSKTPARSNQDFRNMLLGNK